MSHAFVLYWCNENPDTHTMHDLKKLAHDRLNKVICLNMSVTY